MYVAVQEKSRYVAERIARTESARAWADGFIARYENDDTVAAYRWEVSSAHPCTDVCDMYANADLWGLGKGIYPKDQCPTLPAHPHCLCYLSPIYEGEVDLNEQQDLREEGGNHWLQKQSKDVQRQLLGVQGAKAWEAGRPWQDVLRNYSPAVMKSRVSVVFKEQTKAAKNGKMEENKEKSINYKYLEETCKLNNVKYNQVKELKKTLSTEEIVKRLGGGDNTAGSCSSLALAYIGNRGGFDVLDFRGGNSRKVFASKLNIARLAKLKDVISFEERNTNDFSALKN